MNIVLLITASILIPVISIVTMLFLSKKSSGNQVQELGDLKEATESRQALLSSLKELYTGMIELRALATKVREVRLLQESLKAERGRVTITQAELETVDNRLRELEEIERELEASGIETKQELNILKKKQDELARKNDNLKSQIENSLGQLDEAIQKIEMNSHMREQVELMKSQLLDTQSKIEIIKVNIDQGNDQYAIMKTRYDALDIEYAQLYEKFSEAEAAAQAQKENG